MIKPAHLLLFLLACLMFGNLSTQADQPEIMKVMTLNVGHARADGRNQFLQSSDQAKQHLWRIANVLKRENPHVAAFQEIDLNSFWNGSFDHTSYVAGLADYPHFFSGVHFRGGRLAYGTALVARQILRDQLNIRFGKPFARPGKGFVLSVTHWPGAPGLDLDLVSVHFDFLTRSKRLREAEKLIATLRGRDNPRIVMGDLNTDYGRDASLIRLLERELDLSTWQPEARAVTFPRLGYRLDWILVSRHIKIVSHSVLPDSLSDHRAVLAELKLIEGN